MPTEEVFRAYKLCLDPTEEQLKTFASYAGAHRRAFNYAHGKKDEARKQFAKARDDLIFHVKKGGASLSKEDATKIIRKSGRYKIPNYMEVAAIWRKERDRPDVMPWWSEVNSWVFLSGFRNADVAWKNWYESLTGKRQGPRMGYPRRKTKKRTRPAFTIHHNVKKPEIRLEGYRHLRISRIGTIRTHDYNKRLHRLIKSGKAVVTSVTVTRGASTWYASVLCKVQQEIPERPTRAARARGTVGIDLGVSHLAVLSSGEFIENPRHLAKAAKELLRAQKDFSRKDRYRRELGGGKKAPWSKNQKKSKHHLAEVHHRVAMQRRGALNELTARITDTWATIVLEDLNVKGMIRRAKGKGRKAKSGLNRAILDVSFGEFRRQIEYKSTWKGVRVVTFPRFEPSSKPCSSCGAVKTKLRLSQRVFLCEECGFKLDRDLNAARNLAAYAVSVDRGSRETINNACGGNVQSRNSQVALATSELSVSRISERSPRKQVAQILGTPDEGKDLPHQVISI